MDQEAFYCPLSFISLLMPRINLMTKGILYFNGNIHTEHQGHSHSHLVSISAVFWQPICDNANEHTTTQLNMLLMRERFCGTGAGYRI